jgi:type II secretory pathway pseudopilin PulG
VIGIIAVLAVLGLRFMHGAAKRSQVERAGQELQSVMQAAIYYHSINHQWPDKNGEASCTTEMTDGKFSQYYLPKNSDGNEEKSSFGTYYCWQQHESEGSDYENAALFDIYLPVKGAHACQLARKIAGTVPNAHAVAELSGSSGGACGDERSYFVRAQVVPSAQSVNEHNGQDFRAIGQCVPETAPECDDDAAFAASGTSCCHVGSSNPTQYKIHFPACAPGQTQKIVYMPAFITYMNSKGKASHTPLVMFDRDYVHTTVDNVTDPTINRSRNPDPKCQLDTDSNQLVCSLTVGVGVKTQNSGVIDTVNTGASAGVSAAYTAGSVGAVYVASCMDEQ